MVLLDFKDLKYKWGKYTSHTFFSVKDGMILFQSFFKIKFYYQISRHWQNSQVGKLSLVLTLWGCAGFFLLVLLLKDLSYLDQEMRGYWVCVLSLWFLFQWPPKRYFFHFLSSEGQQDVFPIFAYGVISCQVVQACTWPSENLMRICQVVTINKMWFWKFQLNVLYRLVEMALQS